MAAIKIIVATFIVLSSQPWKRINELADLVLALSPVLAVPTQIVGYS
jgi:hypothetical protein